MNLKNYISGDIQFKPLYKSLTDEIKKKTSSEPQWVAKISDNLIQENQKAKNINSKELISQTNERLKQFDKELNEIGKMDTVTKNKPHLVSYMENKYQPIENKKFVSETGIKTAGVNNKTSLGEFNKTNATIRGVADKTGLKVSADEDDLSIPTSITMENIGNRSSRELSNREYEVGNMVVTDTDDFQVEEYSQKDNATSNKNTKNKNTEFFSDDKVSSMIATGIRVATALTKNKEDDLITSIWGQRLVWWIGAEVYLKEINNYDTSAWMLEHSLQENPSDIWRGNDSRIAYLINNDPEYLNALDDAIANSNGKTIDLDLKDVVFETGDLELSIHKSTIHVTGHKRDDGKWIVKATLSDTYDFTEFMKMMGEYGVDMGAIANNMAVVSQEMGAINPYNVTVEFYTMR